MTDHEHKPKECANGSDQKKGGFDMLQKIWNVLKQSGLWLVIFTGLLTVFTFILTKMSETNNNIAISTQRGFITFVEAHAGQEFASISTTNPPWQITEIIVTLENSGNTPARKVIIQTNADLFFPSIPDNYGFPLAPQKTKVVLGPKDRSSTRGPMARDQWTDAIDGKKSVFIWGTAVYQDVFPDTPIRVSEFCIDLHHITVRMTTPPSTAETVTKAQIAPQPLKPDITSPLAHIANFQWEQCSQHNCYDEDCKDYADRIKDMRE
jgi:hypothetical protein